MTNTSGLAIVHAMNSKGKGKPFQDVTNRKPTFHKQRKTLGKKQLISQASRPNAALPLPSTRRLPPLAPLARPSATTTFSSPKPHKLTQRVLNPFASVPSVQVVHHNRSLSLDIDQGDRSDPLAVTEYVESIYQALRAKETKLPYAMVHQSYINDNMLDILIDWLVAVHHQKFKYYSSETLHLTVNIIYRYLSRVDVSREQLQLVGITAFFIAAKYEETYPPYLKDLSYICANAFCENDILDMETYILKTIHYDVSIASSHKFLLRFCKASGKHNKNKLQHIANYLLESTLKLQTTFLPSELAAGSLLIALWATTRSPHCDPWTKSLVHHTKYSEYHLTGVAEAILLERKAVPTDLQAVDKKHARVAKSINFDLILAGLTTNDAMYLC